MIRSTRRDDMITILAIAKEIGFQTSELAQLSEMLSDYFSGDSDGDSETLRPKGDRFWTTDEDDKDGAVGVAYCEPERMSDQTWNLLFIAIHPNRQGQGRGGKLLRCLEETLKMRGGRMLLVETSGLPSFERARTFYAKCGFEEEARIRDFYTAGDDKIVFRKVL